MLIPWRKKLNILWWFKNDEDPAPPPWYSGTLLMWYLRNPLHNFASYVIGVKDRDYSVTANFPYGPNVPSDIGQTGWWRSIIDLPIKLPYVSYSGKRIEFYAGWQPIGVFGIRFTIINSSIQAY